MSNYTGATIIEDAEDGSMLLQTKTGARVRIMPENETIRKLEAENERLKARWKFIESKSQMFSPKMDGSHAWRVRPLRATGPTFSEAVDKAIESESSE